jgi:DtxR family transcriptional regulator, Mn-dependent transcriptional regulator
MNMVEQRRFSSKTSHDFQVSVENYLKAIWNLSQLAPTPDAGVSNSELARYLGVTRPSVTGMIQKLDRLGMIHWSEKRKMRLSLRGRKKVFLLLRRHRVIELFLNQTLKLSGIALHDEAERLEHAVSDELLEKMNSFLGEPEHGLDGMKIPTLGARQHEEVSGDELQTLQDLRAGSKALIASLPDYDRSLLEKLLGNSLEVGDRIQKFSREDGSQIRIQVGDRSLELSPSEASQILVRSL